MSLRDYATRVRLWLRKQRLKASILRMRMGLWVLKKKQWWNDRQRKKLRRRLAVQESREFQEGDDEQ